MRNQYYSTLLIIIGLLWGMPAHAEIYRWIDKNGLAHYSDKPPKKRSANTIIMGNAKIKSTQKRKRARSVTNKSSRKKTVKTTKRQAKRSKKITLASNKVTKKRISTAVKPNLAAEAYDLQVDANKSQSKTISDIKQQLCTDKRRLLAALQETEFKAYYDNEGRYRVTWGGDGLYQGKRRFLSTKEVTRKTNIVKFEIAQYCDDPNNQQLQNEARANWIREEYCTLNKAILEDFEHPFMQATEQKILKQSKVVRRLCSKLQPGQYRHDERYYPSILLASVPLPRYLRVEDEIPETVASNPNKTLEQLLALIE